MIHFFPCDPYGNRKIVVIKKHARMQNNMFGGKLVVGNKTSVSYWDNFERKPVAGLVYHDGWLGPYRENDGHYLFKRIKRSFKNTGNILQVLQNVVKRERSRLVKSINQLDIPNDGWRSPRLQLGGPSAYQIIREALRAGFRIDIKRLREPPHRDRFIEESDRIEPVTTQACIGLTPMGKIRINSKRAHNMDNELPAYKLIDNLKAVNAKQ